MTSKLSDAYKLEKQDHDKIISPEATIENFKNNTAKAGLNILKETRRIDNGRLDIPVYFSVCGHDAHVLTGTKKQMGKGVSPILAEASAVMELAERFSLYRFKTAPENIKKETQENASSPLPFSLIAASVLDDRSEETMAVSREFFSKLPFQWVKAYNVTRDKEMSIPLDWFFMINEFNGSSAGNCLEEAVLQGGCEIVERHVCAIICKEKKSVPYIDPQSVTNPSTRELIAKFESAGIKLYINDFSLNTGIPTVGVLAYDPATFPETSEIVWTAGTASSPDKALSRALTEVAQLAGDFNTPSNYVASGLPKFTNLHQADYIITPLDTNTGETIPLSALPDISSANIRDEIKALTRELSRLGFELMVLDTTDPQLKVPACYTIVPGTCFRERAENSSIVMFCAKHIYENNAPVAALSQLDKISGMLPGQYFISFYQGLCHLAMGVPDKALGYLKQALTENPTRQDIPSICSYAGVCLKEMEQYEEALTILKKGIDIDDEREDIFNLMGFCHFMLKQHPQSIDCFRRVLELKPGSAIDHASIASNYREMGEKEKAMDFYEMALAIDPGLEFARTNLEKLQGSI
ncbi:ribosomal protein S12 methylthiotransferase accessory factor [Desulfocicer vacuolatum DSM 3385]|uniref:Ribosomal protein S12 methylthiotransferase accessory factor n=1 Tax=Desulfocicer vacuolatum DSM 3385 TaxID=1121400 RepID=A0A1W2B7P5_9BACT|nr:YcaO-like family protein [Desulfocicer vacuolatum]SMC68985.1 ribosomal protein S12 methylthiotransferase accessory factor [Desulfocicer vacuolatum DSM 3385]